MGRQRCYNTFDVANCDIKVNNTKSTDSGAIYILKGYLSHYTRKIKNLLMHKKNMCGKIKNKIGRVNETHVRIESDTTYRT